jgi:ferric-dicitrate binding protein FerR (iron transport regulator)
MWSQERNSTEQKSLIQIYPGNSKATLTLGDGSQINLMDENLKVVQEYGVTIDNDSVSGLQYNQIDVMVEVPVYHTIVVPVTGEYSFTLSDGTKVWMNSDSELRFPTQFVGDKREIFLKGEIYLEVATDSARPFIVHTPEVAVQVLGTKFNMAAYTNEKRVVTTLLEGAVKVMGVGKQQQLRPGEQAIVHLDDATIRTEQVDASVFVSWIKGVFEYENMPLEEIAIQLERWYDVKFVFAAPEFKSRRFTGVVKKYEVLNDVLKLIEKTTNVCFTMNGRVIAVQEVDK